MCANALRRGCQRRPQLGVRGGARSERAARRRRPGRAARGAAYCMMVARARAFRVSHYESMWGPEFDSRLPIQLLRYKYRFVRTYIGL